MITIVMPPQPTGAERLTIQTSPTVPSGVTTLRAVATLTRVPGREVSRWSVDGAAAGTGAWTRVRRNADGSEVWQSSVQVTLADGDHIVTVSFRGMTDGASITAVPGGGGGELSRTLKISGPGDPAGTPLSAGFIPAGVVTTEDEAEASSSDNVYYVVTLKRFNDPSLVMPRWEFSGTAEPSFGSLAFFYCENSLFVVLNSCTAGVYSISAKITEFDETLTYGPVTIAVT